MERRQEISLPRQAGEQARVGGILEERSLSLKGTGYPGDRKGQQNYNTSQTRPGATFSASVPTAEAEEISGKDLYISLFSFLCFPTTTAMT